jgi:hypothetical protein
MKWTLFLTVAIYVAAIGLVSANLSAKDKASINDGLRAAATLSDFIEKRDFTKTLTQLTKAIGPYLGAIGPVVGLIIGLFGNKEPAQFTFMKQMLKHIDTRFDRIDGQFSDVNRKIDYVHVQIEFGIIEQKIFAVGAQFEKLYNAPSTAAKHMKRIFISNYESDFQNSGQKLYDGIMNSNNVFTESLGEAAMQYTENDRKKTQVFMLGLLKLLLQASKIELAYLKAKGFDSVYELTKTEWVQKISKVRSKMSYIDNLVASKYHAQSDKDIERYAGDHSNLHNNDFTNSLYKFLTTKYFWRDWMVLIYKDISGNDVHYVHECSGVIKFRNHGRNIVVASVDKTKRPMSISTAQHTLSSIADSTQHHT